MGAKTVQSKFTNRSCWRPCNRGCIGLIVVVRSSGINKHKDFYTKVEEHTCRTPKRQHKYYIHAYTHNVMSQVNTRNNTDVSFSTERVFKAANNTRRTARHVQETLLAHTMKHI